MRTYAVAYEIAGETEDAAQRRSFLAERIRTFFQSCCRPLDTVWIVKSERHLPDIRDNLAPYLEEGDKLIVTLVADACAWQGLAPDVGAWLQEQL